MSAIDDEIQSFFDKIVSISWNINDHKKWKYKTMIIELIIMMGSKI